MSHYAKCSQHRGIAGNTYPVYSIHKNNTTRLFFLLYGYLTLHVLSLTLTLTLSLSLLLQPDLLYISADDYNYVSIEKNKKPCIY